MFLRPSAAGSFTKELDTRVLYVVEFVDNYLTYDFPESSMKVPQNLQGCCLFPPHIHKQLFTFSKAKQLCTF